MPDLSSDSSTNTSNVSPPQDKPPQEKKPTKPLPSDEKCTKSTLVRAMGFEHPFRTLDVGTIKANTSRAANRASYIDGAVQTRILEEVNTCLQKVTRHATSVKRVAQFAIGQYLVKISFTKLDEGDRIILPFLCPSFSVQEIAKIREGTISDLIEAEESEENYDGGPDDVTEDGVGGCINSIPSNVTPTGGDKNASQSVCFFLALLTALYNRESPRGSSPAQKAVRAFLEKGGTNGSLPIISTRGTLLRLYSHVLLSNNGC